LNSYSEEAHRQLLRALALDGQRNQALAHYADYCTLLKEELGVTPDVRTTALYQRIRAGGLRPDAAFAPLPPPGAPLSSEDGEAPSPFVGRTAELQRLATALQRARQGEGQVLFVTGEAGSGKTTLVQTFAHRVLARADDVVVARGACNAQVGTGDPYLPFREILRLLTGDFDVPATGGVLTLAYEQQLETFVPTVIQALREEGADLVGRLVPAHPGAGESFQADRSSTAWSTAKRSPPSPAALCDQVTRVLRAVARQCALVLVLDDLQWADGGTLNLLAHLGRRLAGSRIFLVGIYRSTGVDADHPLRSVIHELQRMHGEIVLDLDLAGGQDFVETFLDSMPNLFETEFRAQLARQTGGHALFTAALVRQMQEDGTLVRGSDGRWRAGAALDWSQLPPRVEAVVAKRLTRLPRECQELLSIASVEGAVFTAEVLARVLGRPLEEVEDALRALEGSRLSGVRHNLIQALGLERVGDRRVARYQFRHALFQQYLYMRLDAVRRARWHEAVGQALEALHAGHWDMVAARLAYHFEAAELLDLAVGYLFRAGQQAYRLSAPLEAIALYRRGLALLAQLPESTTRNRLELALQLNLEAPLLVTQGWGAPERAAVLERAHALARQLGDTPQLLIVLYALTDLCTAQAKHAQALDYAEQLLALAQQSGDRGYEALGYRMTGTAHFFLGHYQKARAHLENGVSRYAAVMQQTPYPGSAPLERAVFLRAWLPHILLALGYPEQAEARSREALACVQPDGPAYAQAMMLTMACVTFYALARQPDATLRYAEELLTLAETYELTSFQGWAIFCRGWARTALGQMQAGLPEMIAGWEQLQATGTQSSLSPLLTLLAEVYLKESKVEEGEETLERALALATQTGERSHLAEAYRVQGMLHLEKQALEEAEASFMRAIRIAHQQTARLWELRATLALARLWAAQGRGTAARARLARVYDWFSEGFDTPDLVQARAFLAGAR
jgi:tetratricopeptide (TPR) repeat protein/energy-coupling factor transporter ATP-binding protein EcfA2